MYYIAIFGGRFSDNTYLSQTNYYYTNNLQNAKLFNEYKTALHTLINIAREYHEVDKSVKFQIKSLNRFTKLIYA